MDGRKNNKGTKGNKGGRPSKAEELKASALGSEAIAKVYGSLGQYWEHIAKESLESYPHLKLIHEYVYGKPTEKVDMSVDMPQITVNYASKPNKDNGGTED